jgi:shikimate dehydrogenase
MTIDGATRLYAIIGDPVVQVRSPAVYSAQFAKAGVNAILIPAQVRSADFAATLHGLMALRNLDGLLVTSPHKNAALELAERLSIRAQTVGAINALRREADGTWSGDMFDGVGFVSAAKQLRPITGQRALIFGCGGAGAAIAAELAAEGAHSIALVDPDASRATRLRDALATHFAGCDVSAGRTDAAYDIVINASVVGMRDGDGVPGDPGPIGASTIVGDVVLRPADRPTALIATARAQGARVVTGEGMHAGQIDAILRFFLRDG